MNKNDKFHGITPPECENNVNELNDDELDSVAGGTGDQCALANDCRICRSRVPYFMPYDAEVGYSKTVQCPNCGAIHTSTFTGTGFKISLAQ